MPLIFRVGNPTNLTAGQVDGNFQFLESQITLLSIRTEGATLTLATADSDGMSLTPVNITVTVPTQPQGFFRTFNGAGVVTFSGSGVTITDKRITGATNPVCYIVFTSTTTADIIGSEA